MQVTVADGRELVLVSTGSTSYATPPLELGDNDRCAAVLTIHNITGGNIPADRSFAFKLQTSLDGVTWIDEGPDDSIDSAASTPLLADGQILGRYARVHFAYAITAGAGGSALYSMNLRFYRKT